MLVSINKTLTNLLLKSTIVVVIFLEFLFWYRSYIVLLGDLKTLKNSFFPFDVIPSLASSKLPVIVIDRAK